MRSIRNAVLAVLAVSMMCWPAAAATQQCGDLDGSGSVVSSDALRLLRFAVGQEVSLECPGGLHCWDTNANNTCDAEEDKTGDASCGIDDCQGPPGFSGPKGDQGDPGPAGPPSGIEHVRWEFDFEAGALPPDTFSATDFEPGSTAKALSASITLSDVPEGCAFVGAFARVMLQGTLASWPIIDTSGDISDLPGENLDSTFVDANGHPLAGLLTIDLLCFTAGFEPMDPHLVPAVSGSLNIEWTHAARLID